MTLKYSCCSVGGPRPRRGVRTTAFSLVELLTVIFIISLLIGILIPSINSARNTAKKATTSKVLTSIRVGMEMFKNDNGTDFRLTNGYPPSFQHPPIPDYDGNDVLYEGRFPFAPGTADTKPVVYGAHWLPAMLMGVDNQGYVKRNSVPRSTQNLRRSPWLWYEVDPNAEALYVPQRQPFYLDPGNTRTKATKDLMGIRPEEGTGFFPDWEEMNTLPVVVDAFDQPILYYAANTHGKVTNMVEDLRKENREYTGGAQQEGVPYYYHQDNIGFTGSGPDPETEHGWNFGGRLRRAGDEKLLHAIAVSGADLTPDQFILPDNRETFARYIVDRKTYQSMGPDTSPNLPLRPVNADTYLLISAGPDGLYGTNDDVNNMPAWPD